MAFLKQCESAYEGRKHYLFPTPNVLASATKKDLQALRLSRQKIEYIHAVSDAFLRNVLTKEKVLALTTKQEQIAMLTSIKGIGEWTANFVLMTSLRNMNSIAYGDAALNRVLHELFAIGKKPSNKAIDAIFNQYTGWESYLNFYLWKL